MAHAESQRKSSGAASEDAALDYLQARGLHLLARNAHARGGELDLVMRDGEAVVFVEVRYRSGSAYGDGADSVNAGKRRKIIFAAQAFLARNPRLANTPCRFDVIAASGDPKAPQIEWLRDAFRADDG